MGPPEKIFKTRSVLFIPRSDTYIHNVDSVTQAPIETTHQSIDIRSQPAVEDPDSIKFGCGSFLTNHASDRSAMSNSIHKIRAFAFRMEEDTTHDFSNVWMIGVNPAVDDAHTDAHSLMAAPYRACIRSAH
jgi:hypothetical protein